MNMKTIKDASFSQMMLKGALVFCLRETDDAVRTTFQQYTELFQSIHCYAAVVTEAVHGVLVNPHVDQIVLRNLLSLHRFPQRGVIDQYMSPPCLKICLKLYWITAVSNMVENPTI